MLIALVSTTDIVRVLSFLPKSFSSSFIIGRSNSIIDGAFFSSKLPNSTNLNVLAVCNVNKSKDGSLAISASVRLLELIVVLDEVTFAVKEISFSLTEMLES